MNVPELKAIPLAKYERLQDALDRYLRSEGSWGEAKAESMLFTVMIEVLGYERANLIPELGTAAASIVIDGLRGKMEVIDEMAEYA